jgi:polyferredoxin
VPALAAEAVLSGPVAGQLAAPLDPFPAVTLAAEDVALTVNGTPYPRQIIQGYLEFTRREAAASHDPRSYYEWGEILHLFDTATERVLSARAAWAAGFRVTADDLTQFSAATLDSSPTYLERFYGGSRELFAWDATLQILMKKWMAHVADGAGDVSWAEAGTVMKVDEREFARWDAWYRPVAKRAVVVTYPERIRRSGENPPRVGALLLVGFVALLLALWLRKVARSGPRADLLVRWPELRALVKRRIYPDGVRVAVLAVFFVMLGSLAAGSTIAHRNLGSVYLWILWWPLVPFLLFFSARAWCAVCPLATLQDLVQRIPGFGRRRPPRKLATAGIFAIEGLFLAITLFDRTVGLVSSVRLTFAALVLLTLTAVTIAAVYKRRTFCRYLCFFGALAGNYSMASLVELRPNSAGCRGCDRAACLHEEAADACPMLERPRALASNRECNLCLTCVRTCERRSLALRVRNPLDELAMVRRPRVAVALLAAVLVGVVAAQNLGMLEVAGVIERQLMLVTGLSKAAVNGMLCLALLALPVGLLLLFSGGRARRFAFYGYALIPLDLGAHAAHNLLHLLGEGMSVWWVTARLVGVSSPLDIPGGHPGGSMGAALLDASTIRVLQVAVLLLAACGSLVVARRLQRRFAGELNFVPLYMLLVGILGVNLWLFSVPMALRH